MFVLGQSGLSKAIERGIARSNLQITLPNLGEIILTTPGDAEDVCWGLEKLAAQRRDGAVFIEQLRALLALFEQVDEPESAVVDFLRDRGLPLVLLLRDRIADTDDFTHTDCVMHVLKIFALYAWEPGTAIIIQAARKPFNPDGFMWSVVLKIAGGEHPHRDRLFAELSTPLPAGFIAVALLDAANAAAIVGKQIKHPFDSPEGLGRLRGWLADSDRRNFTYALGATAALPFMPEPARSELLELATDHSDPGVCVEAAWAAARMGRAEGITLLSRFASDANTGTLARGYLEELNRADAIPADAKDPEFEAMCEMVLWLAHPSEFGEPPDAIEQYDSRELFWPPTNDRRRLRLFKYGYAANGDRRGDDVGFGMTGSVTFVLFDEAPVDPDPLDVYALHCCWELQMKQDPRAPRMRSIAAGRRLLAAHNSL